MNRDAKKRGHRTSTISGRWIVLGAGVGLVLGAAFGNPGVGMVLGAAVGLLFPPVRNLARGEDDGAK